MGRQKRIFKGISNPVVVPQSAFQWTPPAEPLPAQGPTYRMPQCTATSLVQASTTSCLHSAMASWLVTLFPRLPPIVNFPHSSQNELFTSAYPTYPFPLKVLQCLPLPWGKSQRPYSDCVCVLCNLPSPIYPL